MSDASRSVLKGRVAVVTGGGRGIGRAIALEMAREGAAVVVSSRTQQQLDSVVAEIEGAGGRGLAVVADAADEDQARSPVRAAMTEFGRVDVLVNNVGGSSGGNHDPFSGDAEAFMGTLRLNLISAFWTSQEALAPMREQGCGRIINIGSGASKRAAASVAYTAAKHGLVGLTKQLAMSAAPYGITVNCLCPGWTNTALVDFEKLAAAKGVTAAQAEADAHADSAQRRILEPEELAPMAVLLASEAGGGITGQVISVDGGYRL
ncbi:SDR family NAD(P)-dependent oxidoreductase [Candidatus Poriferisocius sp.]|uniref:SDR family NAD(P)-dependent oxidoreductase n=1 Tax=Candidatus Poriferisocius sp. TaxID=3101276 RepID=UPI003B024482